jgi:hypothetical protein
VSVLSPIQFPGKADTSDSDRDKAAEYDAKGSDSEGSYGYGEEGATDYQYQRYGRDETDTNPERETF